MKKRFIKINKIRLIFSATTLCAILTGCGAKDKITTEEVENDLVQTETDSGEYSYLYDRLADEYGEFKVNVKENGKVYTIVVSVDDEVCFDYELVYDEKTSVFTCNENIILNDVELIGGNTEYVTTSEITDNSVSNFDYKQTDKNYGKRFKLEEVDTDTLKAEKIDTSEIKADDTVYKITYLDLGENAESTEEKEAADASTEETGTTESVMSTSGNEISPTVASSSGGSSSGNTGSSGSSSGSSGTSSGNTGSSGSSSGSGSVTPSTTETPTTTVTSSTTEVHEHTWKEVWGEKKVSAGVSAQECLYCGYISYDTDDIATHCNSCGGVWTAEELKDKDPVTYNSFINRPKGSNWKVYPVYETQSCITHYECTECGAIKPAD